MTLREEPGAAPGRSTAAAVTNGVVLTWQRLQWNLQVRGPREIAREVALSTWREIVQGDEFLFFAPADAISTDSAPRRRALRPGHTVCRYACRDEIPPGHLSALRACIAKPAMPESAVDHYLARLLLPLEKGGELWLGLADGVPAGWLWTTSDPRHIPREFPMFPLSKGDVVVFAAHTHPVWSGRAVAHLLLRTACTQLAREGARRFYARVKTWNLPSANGLRKEGFREIGIVRPLALFGRSVAIWKRW
jgi:hypothetical protein